MTTLTENANSILSLRYLQEGETPEDMFRRVANAVAEGERNYGGENDIKDYAVKLGKTGFAQVRKYRTWEYVTDEMLRFIKKRDQ